MKHGSHHTQEAREKIRQGLLKRWKQDPEFRARQLANLRAGAMAGAAARRFLPPKGTPAWRQYDKIRRHAGVVEARASL